MIQILLISHYSYPTRNIPLYIYIPLYISFISHSYLINIPLISHEYPNTIPLTPFLNFHDGIVVAAGLRSGGCCSSLATAGTTRRQWHWGGCKDPSPPAGESCGAGGEPWGIFRRSDIDLVDWTKDDTYMTDHKGLDFWQGLGFLDL